MANRFQLENKGGQAGAHYLRYIVFDIIFDIFFDIVFEVISK